MNGTDPVALEAVATRFREAIECWAQNERPEPFQSFPRGCCGDASELLAAYLESLGFVDVFYVTGSGTRDWGTGACDWCSHAWVEVGSYIVDITASQFSNSLPHVWVTRDRTWHDEVVEDRRPAGFHGYDDRTIAMLGSCYHRLVELLSSPRKDA